MNIVQKLKSFFKTPQDAPRRFWTSDLHFGHKNVITYCDRPWADKEAMNEGLVKLWNEQVRPQDEVFIGGDFSLSPKAVIEYAHCLNGKKHLVLGNHDAPFNFHKNPKALRMKEKYLKDFASVEMSRVIELKDGRKVLMAHMPYANAEQKKIDSRYWDERPKDKGMTLLHGHLHCKYVKSGRMLDIGIDHNFKLYSEDDVIALINDERTFIPSRITEFYKTRPQKTGMKGQSDDEGI
jgi:calcineurin-like phosphoesterase family protein